MSARVRVHDRVRSRHYGDGTVTHYLSCRYAVEWDDCDFAPSLVWDDDPLLVRLSGPVVAKEAAR
ncbi:hypothetical protein SAMN05216207_10525 [Pseudonocardia ammonioxydans]|uniref:Uncharacterized protein n=1 Tax=Pseudonocardia ammonioxydans TaxID=260086 RepID=A0A1I5GWK3_PSUAM|nr:hypothetical protein [Pseudonocardia ammonioxydans]SFO40339.1 hypothetical protein SAMN05216207_10525 [Pseudonocardia ammonioxydans]